MHVSKIQRDDENFLGGPHKLSPVKHVLRQIDRIATSHCTGDVHVQSRKSSPHVLCPVQSSKQQRNGGADGFTCCASIHVGELYNCGLV